MTRWVIRPLRRLVQAAALVVVVLLPLLALYTHYHEARALQDLPPGGWRGPAVRAVDRFVGDDAARAKAISETQGTLWSARFLGYSLTDPLAGLEAIVGSRAFYVPLMWSLLVPVVLTLLLGRFFCGWICPMNTLLELVDKCRRLLAFLELRQRDARFSLANKYVVLGLSLLLVALMGAPFLALVYPPAVISREMHLIVFGGGVGMGIYLILAIAAFELFVSRRWWCRYVCPGGAVYSLLGRFRLIRVKRDAGKCALCGDCMRACQFGLQPMLVPLTGMECTNCGTCICHCGSDALHYGLVLPLPVSRPPAQDDAAADQDTAIIEPATEAESGGETGSQRAVTVGLLWLLVLCAGAPQTAEAHHILGLPHYSYKENYPQAPTLEYPATTGPYDVLMTSYPGKPVPQEAATVAFYIKHRDTSRMYGKPVTLRVLKTSTFGANQVIFGPDTREMFDNEYQFTITFPDDGEYVAELTMDVEGREEVIPFLVVSGNPTATVSVLVLIGIGLVAFIVIVRAIKIKQGRRLRTKGELPSATEDRPAAVANA